MFDSTYRQRKRARWRKSQLHTNSKRAEKRVRTPRRISHLSSSYRCRKNVFYFVCSTQKRVWGKNRTLSAMTNSRLESKESCVFHSWKNGWKMCVIRDKLRKISRMLAHTTHREFHRLLLSLVARHTSIWSHSFNRSSSTLIRWQSLICF